MKVRIPFPNWTTLPTGLSILISVDAILCTMLVVIVMDIVVKLVPVVA